MRNNQPKKVYTLYKKIFFLIGAILLFLSVGSLCLFFLHCEVSIQKISSCLSNDQVDENIAVVFSPFESVKILLYAYSVVNAVTLAIIFVILVLIFSVPVTSLQNINFFALQCGKIIFTFVAALYISKRLTIYIYFCHIVEKESILTIVPFKYTIQLFLFLSLGIWLYLINCFYFNFRKQSVLSVTTTRIIYYLFAFFLVGLLLPPKPYLHLIFVVNIILLFECYIFFNFLQLNIKKKLS